MNLGVSIGTFFVVFIGAFVLTRIVRAQFLSRSILDHPNKRSSHISPTPIGGGIAILLVFFTSILILEMFGLLYFEHYSFLFLLTLILAVISFVDDIYSLHPSLRLLVHFMAVSLAMYFGVIEGSIFKDFLPTSLEKILIVLIWVWFMNLFNFMDGLDGIVGVETFTIGFGVLIISSSPYLGFSGLVLAAAAGGFLLVNWHPAKIFLGDVGSIPIGFLSGWLLISLVEEGKWLPALILPLYFLVDTGCTLIKRLVRFQKIWEAHRDHFYQFAVKNGRTHSSVSLGISLANLLLIGFAYWASSGTQIIPVIGSLVTVFTLIFWMLKSNGASKNCE